MVKPSPFLVPPQRPAPVAPTEEQWRAMSQAERDRFLEDVLDALSGPAIAMSEGRPHKKAKSRALDMLGLHFRALGRRIYLAEEMAVVYPGQQTFTPDVLAVLDVEEPEDDPRMAWVVADEKRGLDWVLEVLHAGDRKKDLVDNVERYAALEIPEYFVYDKRQQRIHAYRLSGNRRYQPVLAQAGLYRSNVLGLDLAIVDGSLRFFQGAAELYDTAHLIRRLQGMVGNLEARSNELEARSNELEARSNELEAQLELAGRAAERALVGLRRAVEAVLKTRGLGCSEETRARLDACGDPEVLNLWLSRATTAASEAEVFSE
ncbi:MAG: Uma2 family endonuclease [Polyangiaceae bacterium]